MDGVSFGAAVVCDSRFGRRRRRPDSGVSERAGMASNGPANGLIGAVLARCRTVVEQPLRTWAECATSREGPPWSFPAAGKNEFRESWKKHGKRPIFLNFARINPACLRNLKRCLRVNGLVSAEVGSPEFGLAGAEPVAGDCRGQRFDSVGVVGVQAEGVEVVLCDRDGSGGLTSISDGAVFDKGRCQMLVLSRKVGESIQIAGDIRVTVTQVRGGRVRLSIEAPPSVRIARREIVVKQLEDAVCIGGQEASATANQGSGDDLLSAVEGS